MILIRFHLDLFDHLCGDIVVQVVENKIRKYIEDTSLENYEDSFIFSFEKVITVICIKNLVKFISYKFLSG